MELIIDSIPVPKQIIQLIGRENAIDIFEEASSDSDTDLELFCPSTTQISGGSVKQKKKLKRFRKNVEVFTNSYEQLVGFGKKKKVVKTLQKNSLLKSFLSGSPTSKFRKRGNPPKRRGSELNNLTPTRRSLRIMADVEKKLRRTPINRGSSPSSQADMFSTQSPVKSELQESDTPKKSSMATRKSPRKEMKDSSLIDSPINVRKNYDDSGDNLKNDSSDGESDDENVPKIDISPFKTSISSLKTKDSTTNPPSTCDTSSNNIQKRRVKSVSSRASASSDDESIKPTKDLGTTLTPSVLPDSDGSSSDSFEEVVKRGSSSDELENKDDDIIPATQDNVIRSETGPRKSNSRSSSTDDSEPRKQNSLGPSFAVSPSKPKQRVDEDSDSSDDHGNKQKDCSLMAHRKYVSQNDGISPRKTTISCVKSSSGSDSTSDDERSKSNFKKPTNMNPERVSQTVGKGQPHTSDSELDSSESDSSMHDEEENNKSLSQVSFNSSHKMESVVSQRTPSSTIVTDSARETISMDGINVGSANAQLQKNCKPGSSSDSESDSSDSEVPIKQSQDKNNMSSRDPLHNGRKNELELQKKMSSTDSSESDDAATNNENMTVHPSNDGSTFSQSVDAKKISSTSESPVLNNSTRKRKMSKRSSGSSDENPKNKQLKVSVTSSVANPQKPSSSSSSSSDDSETESQAKISQNELKRSVQGTDLSSNSIKQGKRSLTEQMKLPKMLTGSIRQERGSPSSSIYSDTTNDESTKKMLKKAANSISGTDSKLKVAKNEREVSTQSSSESDEAASENKKIYPKEADGNVQSVKAMKNESSVTKNHSRKRKISGRSSDSSDEEPKSKQAKVSVASIVKPQKPPSSSSSSSDDSETESYAKMSQNERGSPAQGTGSGLDSSKRSEKLSTKLTTQAIKTLETTKEVAKEKQSSSSSSGSDSSDDESSQKVPKTVASHNSIAKSEKIPFNSTTIPGDINVGFPGNDISAISRVTDTPRALDSPRIDAGNDVFSKPSSVTVPRLPIKTNQRSILEFAMPMSPAQLKDGVSKFESFKKQYFENGYSDLKTTFDFESDEGLFEEDLLDDDVDVFFVQCPKEVDPKSLVGQSIDLSTEESVVNLSVIGKYDVPHDVYCDLSDTDFGVNVVIPSRRKKKFALCTVPLAGRFTISESVIVPDVGDLKSSSPPRVPFPENLKPRNSWVDSDDSGARGRSRSVDSREELKIKTPVSNERLSRITPDSSLETATANNSRKKKKREGKEVHEESHVIKGTPKKVKLENEQQKNDALVEESSRKKEKKKKKGHDEELSSSTPLEEQLPKKHKKKKKQQEKYEATEIEPDNIVKMEIPLERLRDTPLEEQSPKKHKKKKKQKLLTDPDDVIKMEMSPEKPRHTALEEHSPKKHKKKKKHKEELPTTDQVDTIKEKRSPVKVTDTNLEEPVKKKKKKKRHDELSTDLDEICMPVKPMPTALLVTDTSEEPTKKKKKKKKYEEQMTSGTGDETDVPLPKKKKKEKRIKIEQ